MLWAGSLIILIIISAALSGCYKKFDRTLCRIINVILILAFSLIIAFRPDTVPDTMSYIEIFGDIDSNVSYGFDLFGEYDSVEYGFLYLIKFFKYFSHNAVFFFFVVCFISVSITMKGIQMIVRNLTRREMCFPFVFAVYISYFGIYYNGIAIRQGLAIAFCTLALAFLLNRKYVRGLLLTFVAFMFHRLSFIAFLIFLLYKLLANLRISFKAYFICLFILLVYCISGLGYYINKYAFSLLLSLLNLIGLGKAYNSYIENWALYVHGFPYRVVLNILLGFLLLMIGDRNKESKNLLNIYLVGLITLCTFFGISAIYRGADYFMYFSVLLVACSFTLGGYVYKEKSVAVQSGKDIAVKNNPMIKYVATGVLIVANLINVLSIAVV